MCYACSLQFLLGLDVTSWSVKDMRSFPQFVLLATIRKTMEVNPKHSIMVELKPPGEDLSGFFHHGQQVKWIKDQTPANCHIYIKIYDEI